MKKFSYYSILLLISLNFSVYAGTIWHFKDHFTSAEKRQVKYWLNQNQQTIKRSFAPFPFDVHFFIHHNKAANQPVPWANTERELAQGVHFHINPEFKLSDFQQDWTASHEVLHLLLPYLGRDNRWLAEGFASYYQYQIMHTSGQISAQQAIDKLTERFQYSANHTGMQYKKIKTLNDNMFKTKVISPVYWFGAAYFLHVDKRLALEKNIRLADVIARYQYCCRQSAKWGNAALVELLAQLDTLSSSSIFTQTHQQYINQLGFPPYYKNLQWLSKQLKQ